MNKILLIISILAVYVSALTSCKNKKQDVITPVANNASRTVNQFFANNGAKKQSFTINVDNSTAVVTGDEGTVITFPKGAFSTKTGQAVSGEVKIQLIEIFNQADMLLSDRPTTSNGQILVSGGEIYIGATSNGEELQLNDSTSILFTLPSDSVDNDMTLFTGGIDSSQFNWTVIPDVVTTQNQGNLNDTSWAQDTLPYFYYDPSKYIFTVSTLGWINCDRFYNSPNTTDIKVVCNGVVDDYNTRAFLVFNSINSVSSLWSYTPGVFDSAIVPVGESVSVVVLTLKDGKEYIGLKDVIITNDMEILVNLTEASEVEIKAIIKQKFN